MYSQKLSQAFLEAAEAIEKEFPVLWRSVQSSNNGDSVLSVEFLSTATPFLDDKAPLDLARESPEGHERALTFVQQVDYGVYI